MSTVDSRTSVGWRQLADMEKGLLLQIKAAEDELQRIECLSEEQRAEIHAILEAMEHETQFQANLNGTYVSEAGHA